VAFGADYSPYPILTFRGGVQWNPTPTPDIGRTLRVPDGDRWYFTAGADLTVGEHLTVEGALEYIKVNDSRVNSQAVFFAGTPAETVANYLADVNGNVFVISGGARWKF
jgi:long-chain fatty acid transport protein